MLFVQLGTKHSTIMFTAWNASRAHIIPWREEVVPFVRLERNQRPIGQPAFRALQDTFLEQDTNARRASRAPPRMATTQAVCHAAKGRRQTRIARRA